MDKYNIKLCSREEVGGGGENIHLINACGKKTVDIHINKGLGHYIELYCKDNNWNNASLPF